ncbi:tRNA glutamyl-Q(34) synthetase GluQRS [Castellaniella sp.]|uniref:tRNA glutamyl-Q(34) synthetase GluQRS n=1 Tax=Castellaniella sp. TaxID=1955812 RepID=UPI003A948438
MTPTYVGRFAPSPSGPLHAGSLVSALASYLDARAHHGRWLVRIEDIDEPRTEPGADHFILHQLQALGMQPDAPVVWQTHRKALYARAFQALQENARVYPCYCTRRQRPPGPYPGTCRPQKASGQHPQAVGMAGTPTQRPGKHAPAWRFLLDPQIETFTDRWAGPQSQDVSREVGDFIVRRADGLWAYQLAVVVDDAEQGVTHVVRGADLLGSSGCQAQLARALQLPCLQWLHVPLVLDAQGRKLSKQNHAPALNLDTPLDTLQQAWVTLGFAPVDCHTLTGFWPLATEHWARRFAAV